jgi:inhibitor of KinA sporulation pathway (predicted exonuclease)
LWLNFGVGVVAVRASAGAARDAVCFSKVSHPIQRNGFFSSGLPLSPLPISSSIVVYDLEFTAWEGSMAERWLKPGQFREIVQIGAVRLDAHSLEETAQFETLVKPRLNPVLSEYFERLTGITNAQLAARGQDLGKAYAEFLAFVAVSTTFAFGRDDLIFAENFKLYGMAGVAVPAYTNVVPWLDAHGLRPRHAGDVAEAAGVAVKGQKHDALFDARSVAAGIRALVARGAANPFLGGATA